MGLQRAAGDHSFGSPLVEAMAKPEVEVSAFSDDPPPVQQTKQNLKKEEK